MKQDTRNNWITMMFKCKYCYNCLRKQTVMDDCEEGLRDHERFGFRFGEIGFGGNHVHFRVDVPKKYAVQDAQAMLKSHSAHVIFERHPNFRKRYPRGTFWSSYEHHESTGNKDLAQADEYIRIQREHHRVQVIDDRQKKLTTYAAAQDAV